MRPNYQAEARKSFFANCGVRGVIDNDLTIEILHDLGQTIVTSLPNRLRIIIANGTRKRRSTVKSAIEMGLLVSGARIVDGGHCRLPH
jgi:phosphomannomutase